MTLKTRIEKRLPSAINRIGQDVTVISTTGTYSFKALFQNDYQTADVGRLSIQSNSPLFVFMTKDTDTSSLANGDSVKVGTISYVVREVQPNGYGITRVRAVEAV